MAVFEKHWDQCYTLGITYHKLIDTKIQEQFFFFAKSKHKELIQLINANILPLVF